MGSLHDGFLWKGTLGYPKSMSSCFFPIEMDIKCGIQWYTTWQPDNLELVIYKTYPSNIPIRILKGSLYELLVNLPGNISFEQHSVPGTLLLHAKEVGLQRAHFFMKHLHCAKESYRWQCLLLLNSNWLVVSTPLKNISQLGLLFPIYGKIKHVPNHQPANVCSEEWLDLMAGIYYVLNS